MNCQEARNLVEDALDRSLSGRVKRRLDLHLQHCKECRDFFDAERAEFVRWYRAVNHDSGCRHSLPADFADRLVAAVTARRPLPFFLRIPRWALVAASVAFMFMGALFAGVVVNRVISRANEAAPVDVLECEAPQEIPVRDLEGDANAPHEPFVEETVQPEHEDVPVAISTPKAEPTTTGPTNDAPSVSIQEREENENMNIRQTTTALAAALTLAAGNAQAETYYMKGQDAAGKSSFSGARSATSVGWATTRNGSPVATATMSGNDFIIQSGTRLRTGTAESQSFEGASLTIESGGDMYLKAGDLSTKVPGTISFSSLIGDGGRINHAVSNTQTINGGLVSINPGSSLSVGLTPDGRTLVIASTLTGDATTTLNVISSFENSGTSSQTLELQSAAEFLGTISGTRAYDRGTFTLKLTGGFGGTITSLPANTSQVLVNIDDATTANGLRFATTTIPEALKTALVLYTDTRDTLSAGDAVMTFPAGTTVDPAEFTVAFAHGVSGATSPLPLETAENGDGTVSLVVKNGSGSTYVWTGAEGDGKMSTNGNWDGGAVPGAGAALDFSAVTAATAIVANGISYGAVTMGTGVITFTGSLTATSFSNTSKIAVGANSIVTLDGDLEFSNASATTVAYSIAAGGKFVVTGKIIHKSTAAAELKPLAGNSSGENAGVIVAKGLVANKGASSNNNYNNTYFRLSRPGSYTANWIVGADGLSGEARYWCFNKTGSTANIQPDDSDFNVATTISVDGTLNLNTTGYDGNPHRITFSGNGSINQQGTVNIIGNGTVKLASSINGGLKVNVKDTATLSVKRGKSPGNANSNVTVESGATLEIAESAATAGAASVTPLGNLTLNDGATLKFNFTDRRIAPVLGHTAGKTTTVNSTVYVKVSADASIERPSGGKHILTSGIDFTGKTVALADGNPNWVKGVSVDDSGNIVIDFKPTGFIFIIK